MCGRISAAANSRTLSATSLFSSVRLKSTIAAMVRGGGGRRRSVAVGDAPRAGLRPPLEPIADPCPDRAVAGGGADPDLDASVGQARAVRVRREGVVGAELVLERP